MTNYLHLCPIIAVAIMATHAIGEADESRPNIVPLLADESSDGGVSGSPAFEPCAAPVATKSPRVAKAPVVLGRGVGLFQVGKLLARDDFENLDNWVVQIQKRSGADLAKVAAQEKSLDCFLPGRGCTVWFKRRLPTRVTISYDVLCPTPRPPIKGLQPRDINNFWMASDPLAPEQGLFDSRRYTGKFSSYDKLHGYYASTGGGGNSTTRMRRYPRDADNKPVRHLALTDKDGKPEYLIKPDKVMTVQLVAYDDVIQYIVDGKLVYEIARGDAVQVEGRNSKGKPVAQKAVYDLERFPVYRKGYFGFRMVGTHHIYTNFRVYALKPANDSAGDSDCDPQVVLERASVKVSTLSELRAAVREDNQTIAMAPGRYTLTDLPNGSREIRCSGSNNTIDLTGVHVDVPVGATRRGYITVSGNNNVLRGGVFEDIYRSRLKEVTDFSAYNQDRTTLAKGLRGSAVLTVRGDANTIAGVKLTVRGSFPYGYGSIYGIGSDNVYGLDKRCGILVKGEGNTIDGCEIQQRAFGHGIYLQPPADRTVVKNCLVEGRMRPSEELYEETDPRDLPARSEYRLPQRGNSPIPKDVMLPLAEDGIRVYRNGGSVTVENCTVKRMRGGIRLYLGSRATVTNSTAIDCGSTNFNMPRGGRVVASSGNFAYAPLSDFRLAKSRQDLELTILPSPHAVGPHNVANILGDNHNIVFHRADGPLDTNLRPIVVEGDDSTIRNETEYPLKLQPSASGNTVVSFGPVTDLGKNNKISRIDKSASDE